MDMDLSRLNEKPAIRLLKKTQQAGRIVAPDGRAIPFEDQLDEVSYAALYEVLRLTRPERALELGFAHGCATLYMLQALVDNQGGQLVSVDPMQAAQYRSGGLLHVQMAGFDGLHRHLAAPSQIVLPQLMLKGYKCQFVFIDTTHQFDQTIVELYYADKLIPPGGIIALHDYEMPSVRAACNFFEANLNYRLHACHRDNLRVLQKTADDRRKWYEFVPFEVPGGNQALAFEK